MKSDTTRPPDRSAAVQAREHVHIRRAREYGIDVDRIRSRLALTPEERLGQLEANLAFLREVHAGSPRRPC
jgi:hypothetical protein